jgi:predicted Zn-dependent protease
MLKILRFVMGFTLIVAVGPTWAAAPVEEIARAWAVVKYGPPDAPDRRTAAEAIERDAAALVLREDTPATRVWLANALCLTAEVLHSTKSLTKVREARDVLLAAERTSPENPAVLALLGSLHYEVPGWPIGFGNKKKAQEYLTRAVAADPAGRDTNYFMGDFLLSSGRAGEAVGYLEKALAAPQQNELADRGRRAEISEALAKAKAKTR